MSLPLSCVMFVSGLTGIAQAQDADTFPPLREAAAPTSYAELWGEFDPRKEPLEAETLAEWQEDGVSLRIVRFRIGVFKGTTARLAAVYGYPTAAAADRKKLPGLLQIHGGGQYADHRACVANARRGYATLSIAWAGRISAPDYRVGPDEVRMFWENDTGNPAYRVTTDWGAVDGYHAPGRNAGNQFPSARAAEWTLDDIESPRNSGWFLCAVAARRALTFLERQPQVDADRLGVYGHSMGGKLTVMTAPDSRVKAAAPSCGGISDRDNDSELFRKALGDDVFLREITCPVFFLSPANDFHGRIGDLPIAVDEIQSEDWRVTCSPHHNHQDTPEYEAATLLWFDQHLKKSFQWPRTPETQLEISSSDGVPRLTVIPDTSRAVVAVDVFYTVQGREDERPEHREDTMHRFWHHAELTRDGDRRIAALPLSRTDRPLWAFANVRYRLDAAAEGVGYYYGAYSSETVVVSSLLSSASPDQLAAEGARATLKHSDLIEDFAVGESLDWFSYRPSEWALTTNKLNADLWKGPEGSVLAVEVQADQPNTLVVVMDNYCAAVTIPGGTDLHTAHLKPSDFADYSNEKLSSWQNVRRLRLTHAERLRPARGGGGGSRIVGGAWKGPAPKFGKLQWLPASND